MTKHPTPVQRARLTVPLAALAMLSGVPVVRAQSSWPTRPVRLVVPYPPGGSSDNAGRILADKLGKVLNASFVVDNRPGATAQIGNQFVANAAPDGYTVLLGTAPSLTILPNLRSINYSVESFEAAGGVSDYVAVMAVRNTLPVSTVGEFIEYGKAHPGKLSFGSAGEGTFGHIYAAQLAHEHGVQALHVPFRGSAPAINSLLGGEIDFMVDGALTPMVKTDRVRGLATFHRNRHPELPQVPTLAEAGFAVRMSQAASSGLLLPKGTDRAIVQRLSEALYAVTQDRETQEAFARFASVVSWQAPDDWRNGLIADRKMYGELLSAIGITAN